VTRRSPRPRLVGAALLGFLPAACGGDADDLARLDAPPPEPGAVRIEPGDLAVSTLTVPVDVSLDLLADVLEEAVPTTLGSMDERTAIPDRDRISVAYEIERGPMDVRMDEGGAHVASTLSYRVRAWYDPPVLPEVSASCGTGDGEPRPRLDVAIGSPLSLDAEWRLRSEVEVEGISPSSSDDRDRCEVTFLGYDATGRVVDAARSALSALAEDIDTLVAEVDVRSDFEGWWREIAGPVRLDDGVWLVMDPVRVGRTGIAAESGEVLTTLTLEARPRVVLGPRPEMEMRPLPPLDSLGVADESLTIRAEAVAPWSEVTRRLRDEVAGESFEMQGRTLRVADVVVDAVGDGRLSVRLDLGGDVRGTLFLVGTPTYDPERDEIHVDDLDFDVRTRDRLVAGAAWVARTGLIRRIRSAAAVPAGPARDWALGKVEEGFNARISSQVRLEGRAEEIEVESVTAAPDALRIRARVLGAARLIVQPARGGSDAGEG